MSFLQPLFLAGLLAVSLPVIVHLINRRKAKRRPFPALQLLRRSEERVARSIKARRWLLMALRMLVIAALVVALAKPFVFSTEGVTADERLPTATVFVVENGWAMEYDDWWDRAQDALDDEINRLRPWDEVALMTTADDEPLLGTLTAERRRLSNAVDELERRFENGDLAERLVEADDLAAGSELPNRRIVVIGSNTDAPLADRRDIQLSSSVDYIEVQSGDEPIENLAVVDVDYQQEGSSRDGRWRIDAVVENTGSVDRTDVRVQLLVDDTVVGGESVDIDAGESTSVSFDHHVETAGLKRAAVELDDDGGLASDDAWHFPLQPRHQVRALLVNGSPSSVPYRDELYFLTRALAPGGESESGVITSETTPDGLDRRDLQDFDVVVLANVSRLSSDQAEQLRRFVDTGGGLFVSMGDEVDPDAYNRHLDELLPRPLRSRKRLAERDDPDAPVKTTRMGHPQRQHPIFRSFVGPRGGALQSVSIYSYMLLDPAPAERDAELLLTYQNNAPALLERRVGRGRVLLFTSSVDRDWTDFPVRSVYLPLINRSLLHLARRATSATDASYVVGESIDFEIGELVDERAIIRDPDERRIVLEPTEGRASMTPRVPGVYTVYADGEEAADFLESLTFTANVDRRGSRLEPFPHAVLEQWQPDRLDDAAEGDGDFADQRRINLWSKFLFAVALFLLVETVLGARRSVLLRTFDKIAFWRDE